MEKGKTTRTPPEGLVLYNFKLGEGTGRCGEREKIQRSISPAPLSSLCLGNACVFRFFWAHCSDTKVASLWGSRRGIGNHCALICWCGHLMINYGCAATQGPTHQPLRLGVRDEARLPLPNNPANSLPLKQNEESEVRVETF